MTIDQRQREIVDHFSQCTEWMDRYERLIRLGMALPKLNEGEKTPESLVPGCQSRAWIVSEKDAEGSVTFRAESDAAIISGILALILQVVNGCNEDEIRQAEFWFIEKIGLREHLSATRANGIKAVIDIIKGVK